MDLPPVFLVLLLAASSATVGSCAQAGTTYCNPLDLDYQYNFEQRERNISYRSGADPVLINHKGEYYLFGTIADGYWHSKNLRDWRHVKPTGWPARDMVAPAALSAKGKLFLFPATYEQRPIYLVTGPEPAELTVFNPRLPYLPGAPGPWDPALFHDAESDRWYLYFGSSNFHPIYGIELDYENQLSYRDTAKELLALHPDQHGWERFGRDHRDTIKPFIEGAWMTKYQGRYYLQYAAPGTEYNVYANGAYVSDAPLGPFTYAPNNPVSYKPGGFLSGAGHGNTFQDAYGNFWNTGTPWIAVNFNFERRIAMFPAGFDQDGLLFANTRFGDFPHYAPTRKWASKDELFTGWMLVSYRKPCAASSVRYPYAAANVTDENPRTFWLAASKHSGEHLTVDLDHPCEIRAVQVNFTDYHSGLFGSGTNVYTQFLLRHSLDGKTWTMMADLSDERRDRPNAYVELATPVRARYVQYEHVHVGSTNLAISDIRVFGFGEGDPPSTPARLQARRDTDARNAFITWEEVPGVVGYNVLWGIQPDKLYQTYQVFADQGTALELRALNVGQKYSFAIEAFNERGVSKASEPVLLE
jgi:hypothetical protein